MDQELIWCVYCSENCPGIPDDTYPDPWLELNTGGIHDRCVDKLVIELEKIRDEAD